MRYAESRGKITHYDDVEELWSDAIYRNKNDEGELKLQKGRVIRVMDFNFSEWFPWAPGMYWTSYGNELRNVARDHKEKSSVILDKINQSFNQDPNDPLLDPWGS